MPMLAECRNRRAWLAAAILSSELVLLAAAYRFGIGMQSELSPSQGICATFGGQAAFCAALPTILDVAVLITLVPLVVYWYRGAIDFVPVIEKIERAQRPDAFLFLHLLGVFALTTPWLSAVAGDAMGPSGQGWIWTAGTVLAVVGFVSWLFDPRCIREFVTPVRCLAAIAPILVALVAFQVRNHVWTVDWIQVLTFMGTGAFLRLLGQPIDLHQADELVIGVGDFRVQLLEGCSGYSGMALVCMVIFLYALATRQRLRMDRVLLLLPAAIVLSGLINVLRISAIMLIGAHVSPDLAMNAFHSYAGWIAFALLSACLMMLAESVPWFSSPRHHSGGRDGQSFFADRKVAEILPFVLLMACNLIVGALFSTPASGYPIIALVTGLSTIVFLNIYLTQIDWRLDPLALLCGFLIAALWIVFQGSGEPQGIADILGSATPAAIALWMALRVIGTTVFIPIIEELFFRSYLLGRLNFGGAYGALFAVTLSSIAFASLHGEWLLAFAAGLVFGGLVLRSGKVGDAIVAHAVANGTIAMWAISFDDWSVI